MCSTETQYPHGDDVAESTERLVNGCALSEPVAGGAGAVGAFGAREVHQIDDTRLLHLSRLGAACSSARGAAQSTSESEYVLKQYSKSTVHYSTVSGRRRKRIGVRVLHLHKSFRSEVQYCNQTGNFNYITNFCTIESLIDYSITKNSFHKINIKKMGATIPSALHFSANCVTIIDLMAFGLRSDYVRPSWAQLGVLRAVIAARTGSNSNHVKFSILLRNIFFTQSLSVAFNVT